VTNQPVRHSGLPTWFPMLG